MKTTPFTEKHIALGAKMHEFAGYNMPIEYWELSMNISLYAMQWVYLMFPHGRILGKRPECIGFLAASDF